MIEATSSTPESIPTLVISAQERAEGRFGDHNFRGIYEDFRRSGCLLVKGAYHQQKLEHLHALYLEKYEGFHQEEAAQNALEVGNRRRLVTVTLEGAFNDPEIYANPFILNLVQLFTNRDAVLGSFGTVVSLPGAEDQGVHADHPPLFDDEEFDLRVPPFAILMGCPLIEMNDFHGTTAVWPGSHALSRADAKERCSCVLPVVEVGDALMMDYRILHAGSANRSEVNRPVLYYYYARPWFRDCVNYLQQNAIDICESELQRVPAHLRYLFAYTQPKAG